MMNPPDLPPPLPNQPPVMPAPRKGMSTGVLVLIIIGAVAVLFAGLAALAIPSYQRIQKMAEEINAKRATAL